MKKLYLTGLLLLSSIITQSIKCDTVFTPQGEVKNLQDYVQDGLSRLSGEKNYNKLDPQERRTLLNNAVMRVYRTCGSNCYSSCANTQIQEELADFVCKKLYDKCLNSGFYDYDAQKISKKVRNSIQEKINNNQSVKWKYGLANGVFDNYLGQNSTYEIQRAQEQLKQQQQEDFKNDAISAGLVGFLAGFFTGLFSSLSDEKENPQPVPTYQAPMPSAPVKNDASVCPKKFYIQEKCCSCMERFGQGQQERIFFSCGHCVCKGCTNSWVMEHKSCPQCRENLKEELFKIKRAADNAAYCCTCGNHENNMVKMHQCAHKVCRNCYAGWQKTELSSYCPKCNVRQ